MGVLYGYRDTVKHMTGIRSVSFSSGAVESTHYAQSQIWHQVEQQYSRFKQRHAAIVNGIELLNRYIKPFTMKAVHPIMSHNEK